MVRTLLFVAAALSLLIAPLVLSQDAGEGSPPAEEIQRELERLFGESPPPFLGQKRQLFRVVPDVRGVRGSWTCLAQADPESPAAQTACDFGRELSRMEPCTRPEDCQALDLWTSQVGPPSLRQTLPADEIRRPAVMLTRQDSAEVKSLSEDVDPESAEDEP